MNAISVILQLAVIFPNQAPVTYQDPRPSIDVCIREAKDFAEHPPHAILIAGGTIHVACQIVITPSQEH